MFRAATANSGAVTVIEVTAALNVAIAAETLGFSNNTPGRLWVCSINDGGAVSLALINCLSGTSIFPLAGWGIASSVTQQAGGVNTPQIFVGAAAHTNVPYSVLGHMSWEAPVTMTAGTWVAPSRVDVYRPGMALPGAAIQSVGMSTSSTLTTGSASYVVTSISQAITLSSSANVVRTAAYGWENPAVAASVCIVQIQRGATGIGQPVEVGAGALVAIGFSVGPVLDAPGAFSNTYAVYVKGNGANNTTVEGGGILVEEIMA